MNDILISPNENCIDMSNCEKLLDTSPCNKKEHSEVSSETNELRKFLIDKSIHIDPNLECIICFEKNKYPIVTCSLCSNYSHYTCYKKFTKKNGFYKMKCVHCGTRSVQFRKKWWQAWWCYG